MGRVRNWSLLDRWAHCPDLDGPHKNGCQHSSPGSKAILVKKVLSKPPHSGESNPCPHFPPRYCEFQMR